jgi:hypothetical protein
MTAYPLIAELGSVEKTIITGLAVAGGFLVGFVVTHMVAKLLAKFVFKKAASEGLLRLARLGGGIGAAILVYFLLTGPGGLGLGGGGGEGNKPDRETNKDQTPKQEMPKSDLKNKGKSDQSGEEIFITVLRADSPDKKFYRLDDNPENFTKEELLRRITNPEHLRSKPIVRATISPVKTADGKVDLEYSVTMASVIEAELRKLGIKTYRE